MLNYICVTLLTCKVTKGFKGGDTKYKRDDPIHLRRKDKMAKNVWQKTVSGGREKMKLHRQLITNAAKCHALNVTEF